MADFKEQNLREVLRFNLEKPASETFEMLDAMSRA